MLKSAHTCTVILPLLPVMRMPEQQVALREELTHLFHDVQRENPRGESSAEDVGKLLVEAADAHFLKVPIGVDDGLPRLSGLGFPCAPIGQICTF